MSVLDLFLRNVQRVIFEICNLVHTSISKSLDNFLTFRIIVTSLS